MKSVLFFLLALCFLSGFVFADEGEIEEKEDTYIEENVQTISDFRFVGLKKTQTRYLKRVLKDFVGKEITEESKKEIENALQQLQLFEEISLSSDSGENGVVEIALKEKISFLPIPIVASSNGSFMAGAFVMDTNALGEQDAFMLGGLWSTSSLLGMATFSVQAKDLSHPGFSLSASAIKGKSKIDDEKKERLFEYERKGFNFGAAVTEKINKYLSLGAGVGYSYLNVDESGEYEAIGLDRMQKITPSLSIALGKSDWNGVFISSQSLGISTGMIFGDYYGEKNTAKSVSAKIAFQQPIIDTLRIIVGLSGVYGVDEDITNFSGEGSAGVTILADDFCSEKIGGGSAGLEWAFAQGKYATFSAYGLYEAAAFTNFADEKCFEQGFEVGMKSYLKKIAFPALAFGLSYNATEKFWNYSFAFGAQF